MFTCVWRLEAWDLLGAVVTGGCELPRTSQPVLQPTLASILLFTLRFYFMCMGVLPAFVSVHHGKSTVSEEKELN